MLALRSVLFLTLIFMLGSVLSPILEAADGTEVGMHKRGNVRYGPTTKARVINTLPVGTVVDVLGPTEGRDGWYTIRFPRQGHAWVHTKVLAPTEDPNVFRVVVDGANVRSDARINADLVTQLAYDELVEFKGRKVGEWLGIYPPNAIAYVYKSVLDLSPNTIKAIEDKSMEDDLNHQLWLKTKARYNYYRAAFQQNAGQSLGYDWQGLDDQLAAVVEKHKHLRTRLTAQKLRSGIAKVVDSSNGYLRSNGLQPLADPEFTIEVARADPVKVQPVKPQPQVQPQPQSQSQPQPQPQGPATQPTPPAQAPAADATAVQGTQLAAVSNRLEGWLEQRDDPGVGASYAIIDGSGNVVALLKPKPGADFSLSEFFWRRVSVSGSTSMVEYSQNGETSSVPLVEVDELRLADG